MSIGGSTTLPVSRPTWAVIIRSFAFLRKEVVEILRQPRLIALLVVGPFALLVAFGTGYSETAIVKRAIFVGPEGSIYDEVLASYEDELSDLIDSQGLVPTEAQGRAALRDGRADVVVIFPDDPEAAVMAGDRAVIRLLHDEIDPIQEGAVEIAARLAIQEVNATVLATLATEAQAELPDTSASIDMLMQVTEGLRSDPVGTRDAVASELGRLEGALNGSSTVLGRLELEDDSELEALRAAQDDVRAVTERLATVNADTSDAELVELEQSVTALANTLGDVVILDPEVLVRPFESDTQSVTTGSANPTDYFTPGSLALLLQHLALTFAALSLVRDRRTGLFELMRVGPLSSIEIIVGKIFAYLLVGSAVGAALIAAAVFVLGVSLAGSVGWLAIVVLGVLLSSLALGMVLAIGSGSESQAVQYAMLVLLAGLFFSGFILPIDGLSYPARILSWLLPVTYGIDTMQDIMLRGVAPERTMIVGLFLLVAAYGVLAIGGLRRQLRSGGVS